MIGAVGKQLSGHDVPGCTRGFAPTSNQGSMSNTRTHTARRSRRGQSLVEFALVAPLLVGIIVGIIELGIMFAIYTSLTNTARESARAAAVFRYTGAMPTNAQVSSVMPTIDSQRRLAMSRALTSTLNPIMPATSVTVTVAYLPVRSTATLMQQNPLRAGDTVSVTMQYNHTLLWGLFGRRTIVLQTAATARLEPGGGN